MVNESCPFCRLEKSDRRIIAETERFLAVEDNYPVTRGHTLIIPKRHVGSFFDLSEQDVVDLYRLVGTVRDILAHECGAQGFNIGVNEGRAAGQTVFHLHVHVIPRYRGDVERPEGGIRNIVDSQVPYP